MPKTAMDYTKTIMYHFVCQNTNIKCSYVGSTTNFNQRKGNHKRNCHNESRKEYNYLLYKTIRENGSWDNWTMTPLEEYPCENSVQQLIREQYWIDRLEPELNMRRSYSSEEYKKENNKEYNKQHNKEYRERNIDKIRENDKQRSKLNREKNKE